MRFFWHRGVAALALAALLTGCAGQAAAPSPTPGPTPEPLTLAWVRSTAFSDLPGQDPDHDPAAYTACLGVLGGTAAGVWSPEGVADRAAVATALYRLSGAEAPAGESPFPDVAPDSWYAPAMTWAAQTGILTGRADGSAAPGDPVTRMELAVILCRYAAAQGMDTTAPTDAPDCWDWDQVPQWAGPAVRWCLDRGIFTALVARDVHPNYTVTRAQLAQAITALRAADDPVAGEIFKAQQGRFQSVSRLRHDQLQAAVDAAAQDYGAAGIQVAVLEGGRVTDAFVWGRATRSQTEVLDVETGTVQVVDTGGMTKDHKLRIASLSKVIVAMNALALAEDGKLDLDGSIGQYWNCQAVNRACPDVPVSVRSILSHTSTIPLYGDDASLRYDAVRQRLAQGKFISARPGDVNAWGYNNYAFNVLGMTLELSQNKDYDTIAGENFFRPLGIDAGIFASSMAHPELLADVYRHDGSVGRSAQETRTYSRKYGLGDGLSCFAGGLLISAVDYARLMGVLAGDGAYEGQRMLKPETVAFMETSLGTPYGTVFEQCSPLRLQHDLFGRENIYYHTGSAYGVFNVASYDPDTGDGVVVLTTGASGAKTDRDLYAVCAQISQAVYTALAQPVTAEQPAPTPGQTVLVTDSSPAAAG